MLMMLMVSLEPSVHKPLLEHLFHEAQNRK